MIQPCRITLSALFLSAFLSAQSRSEIIAGLRDSDPQRRVEALRAAEPRLEGRSDLVLQGLLRRMVADPSPKVRLQLANSLGKTGSGRHALQVFATISLQELLISSTEHVEVRAAIIQSNAAQAAAMLRAMLADFRFASNDRGRGATIISLVGTILERRNVDAMTDLIDLLAGQPEGWHRQALYMGVSMHLPSVDGAEDALRFPYRPRALDRLLEHEDAALQELGAKILAVSAWTGGVRPLDREERAQFERGQRLYGLNCLSCHMVHGRGSAALAPPLIESEWVMGSDTRLVAILTSGLTGPIMVAGKRYQINGMIGFPRMGDAQIAALVTYLRRAWDNTGDPIMAADVGRVRAKLGERRGQWTEAELLQLKE